MGWLRKPGRPIRGYGKEEETSLQTKHIVFRFFWGGRWKNYFRHNGKFVRGRIHDAPGSLHLLGFLLILVNLSEEVCYALSGHPKGIPGIPGSPSCIPQPRFPSQTKCPAMPESTLKPAANRPRLQKSTANKGFSQKLQGCFELEGPKTIVFHRSPFKIRYNKSKKLKATIILVAQRPFSFCAKNAFKNERTCEMSGWIMNLSATWLVAGWSAGKRFGA